MNVVAVQFEVLTPSTPGAVALVQLTGADVLQVLEALTHRKPWALGQVSLCAFGDFDEGLAVLLAKEPMSVAQLMPHGGLQVLAMLREKLRLLGCIEAPLPALAHYPEAASIQEAQMLADMAKATSPQALVRWAKGQAVPPVLIDPPQVVVVGHPNAGKSTLLNRLSGKTHAIVSDQPGTTRDFVTHLVELAPDGDPMQAVAVRWFDTPGLRQTDDVIEREAMLLAAQPMLDCAVLVALRDEAGAWPEVLPRQPDLWAINKCETTGQAQGDGLTPEFPIRLSALTGIGVADLEWAVLGRLGL